MLILFVGMPILEMWLLIEVGARIGALPTIGLVLLTATIGLALLRQQGFSTLMRANRKIEAGELPAEEVAEGFALAIGGALLLTPGFVTDAIGFACLLPFSRRYVVRRVLHKVRVIGAAQQFTGLRPETDDIGEVIEGEFSEESHNRPRRGLPSQDL